MKPQFLQELAEALALNAEAQQALIAAQQQNTAAVQQAAAAQLAIAQALTRIATATGESDSPWIDKHQAAELLSCYVEQLKRWRSDWVEGVHYTKAGHKYLYNAPLIMNWQLNRDRPQEHQAEVERWILDQQRAS